MLKVTDQYPKKVRLVPLALILVALLPIIGCGSSTPPAPTEADRAKAEKELAVKRAAVEADPKMPPDVKARVLGAMGSPQSGSAAR